MIKGEQNGPVDIIMEMAKIKLESYNPEKKEDESEWVGEKLGWFDMVLRYSDMTDQLFLWLGMFGAVTFGACLPGICLLFGNMIDGVGDDAAAATGASPMGDVDFIKV